MQLKYVTFLIFIAIFSFSATANSLLGNGSKSSEQGVMDVEFKSVQMIMASSIDMSKNRQSVKVKYVELKESWGIGSFENDSAMDWVYELIAANSKVSLASTLDSPQNQNYIEMYSCANANANANAIAAAEIVSSINSNSVSLLSKEVQIWVGQNNLNVNKTLKIKASKAIHTCSYLGKSELAQLWYESSSEEWFAYLNVIQGRLE